MKIFTRQRVVLSATVLLVIAVILWSRSVNKARLSTQEILVFHSEKDLQDRPSTDFLEAMEYEFNMVKDPKTGKIPAGIKNQELMQANQIREATELLNAPLVNSYSFQGPNNLGGRTRALVHDVRYATNSVILAGGVSGGIYKSTDGGASWVRTSPIGDLFSVTSIAQDPRVGNQDTWYYSTGESLGNSASSLATNTGLYLGNGVYKSTDNGSTWVRLANSNTGVLESIDRRQDLISKVIVNPVNGNVYFAAMDGIYRSIDGGTTWGLVLSSGGGSINTGWVADIVVSSTGRFYASFSGVNNASPTDVPGVWTSTTGASASWTKIAGNGAATNPAGWNSNSAFGRVVLAIAPSDEDKVYALYYNNVTSSCAGTPAPEAEFYRWSLAGNSWTDLSANLPDEAGGCSDGNDPFAVQGGYDLVVAVKPDDPNTVFIGGTNIYRSTNGFTSTAATTRIGGYANNLGYALYSNSHPDIHAIAFQPGSPDIMLCGNDGGIQRTTNNLAATVEWTPINNGYRTYQYYYVTLDPRNANPKVLGGAQDNGTTRNIGGTGSNYEVVLGGDGVSVGLSNDIGGGVTIEYCGFQSGDIYRRLSSISPGSINADIRPSAATADGLFITLFRLDPDNTQNLYYANENRLFRNTNAPAATTANWTEMTGVSTTNGTAFITSLANTRGTYNPVTSSLFYGTNTGLLFRLDNPANAAAAATPVNITGPSFPASSYLSSIAVNPRNDDTVLVTFSSYGVTSTWWTGNANAASPTWLNVEGNLTLPSFRSSVIAVTSTGVEYFVGTSAGLYKTSLINGLNPSATNWTQEGLTEIGNAVVSSLALRTIDNRLLVGTHGYGMWATTLPSAALPVTFTQFSGKAESRQNSLLWETQDEQNNKGFELERKYVNQVDFEKIAFIEGANKNGKNSYQYNDADIDLGIADAFYRLKQVDLDGKYAYSSTLRLSRKASAKFIEYLSANENSLLIRVNNAANSRTISIRILDAGGRLVKNLSKPYQTQQIDIASLSAGVYILDVSDSRNNRFTERFVRQ